MFERPKAIVKTAVVFLGFLSSVEPVAAVEVNSVAVSAVEVLDVFRECDACPEMIRLPMGRFKMGSSVEEAVEAYSLFGLSNPKYAATGFANETPKHTVEIDLPIAMGRTEITRAEWGECVKDGSCAKGLVDIPPSAWSTCLGAPDCSLTPEDRSRFQLQRSPEMWQWHPNSPIVSITYDDATDYIAWLNAKVGQNVYRLPTEAEWEYAARSGTTTPFAQGETLTRQQANYFVFTREYINGKPEFHLDPSNERRPIAVEKLDAANSWGLRHMSGNVSEMTRSCWSDRHVSLFESSRYLAASFWPNGCDRVTKGGFYGNDVQLVRPARRSPRNQDGWSVSVGFRVVRDLKS